MIKALHKAMKNPPKADVELEKNIISKFQELLKCGKNIIVLICLIKIKLLY